MKAKRLVKTLFLCLVAILPSAGWARIGETLDQCEQRYGPGVELPISENLKAAGVKAYEFRPSPLVVVAVIGDHEGVMRIGYFAKGKFSPQILRSLMSRNSPTFDEPRPWARPPGEQRDSSFLYGQGITRGLPVDDTTPTWSIGQKGDPASLTATLNSRTFYSQLSVFSYLKEERQKRAAGLNVNISLPSDDLLTRFHQKIENSADAVALDQFVNQFVDEPTSLTDEPRGGKPPNDEGDTSWSLDPTRHPNLSFTNVVASSDGTRINLRNGILFEQQSAEDAGSRVDNHSFWLTGSLKSTNSTFEVAWGYEGGGGDNSAVVQMTGSESEWIGRAATKKGPPVLFRITSAKVSMSWGPRVEGSGERALTVSWPRDEQTLLEDEPATSTTPKGVPVPGKPGFVRSPFDSEGRFIDVRGLPSGTEVRDPYTDQVFVTP